MGRAGVGENGEMAAVGPQLKAIRPSALASRRSRRQPGGGNRPGRIAVDSQLSFIEWLSEALKLLEPSQVSLHVQDGSGLELGSRARVAVVGRNLGRCGRGR